MADCGKKAMVDIPKSSRSMISKDFRDLQNTANELTSQGYIPVVVAEQHWTEADRVEKEERRWSKANEVLLHFPWSDTVTKGGNVNRQGHMDMKIDSTAGRQKLVANLYTDDVMRTPKNNPRVMQETYGKAVGALKG